MSDINSLIDFTIKYLNIDAHYVWRNVFCYSVDVDPYITIDGIDVYYFDNFDCFGPFTSNTLLCSYIVFSVENYHCVIVLHKGIDFIKFFDYMLGYLGYNDLVRCK